MVQIYHLKLSQKRTSKQEVSEPLYEAFGMKPETEENEVKNTKTQTN